MKRPPPLLDPDCGILYNPAALRPPVAVCIATGIPSGGRSAASNATRLMIERGIPASGPYDYGFIEDLW